MVQTIKRDRQYAIDIIALSEKIRENPWDARIRFDRGNVHRRYRNDDLAILDFNVALALDPGYAEAYFYKAICCARLGHTRDELNAYEQFLLHARDDFAPYFGPIKRRITDLRARDQSYKHIKSFRRRAGRIGMR